MRAIEFLPGKGDSLRSDKLILKTSFFLVQTVFPCFRHRKNSELINERTRLETCFLSSVLFNFNSLERRYPNDYKEMKGDIPFIYLLRAVIKFSL